MSVFRFILGVLGIVLVISAISSLFIGGINTESVVLAFGFPILLIIIGGLMVYFGFYHNYPKNKSNSQILDIVKWGVIFTISILLSNYLASKLLILNNFLVILFTTAIVSIIVQIIRSHNFSFNLKWFIFYFLIYANIIWAMGEFILPFITTQSVIISSIILGFTLAGIVTIIQSINLKYHSLDWALVFLIIILIIGNLSALQSFSSTPLIGLSSDSSELTEEKQTCPVAINIIDRPLSETVFDDPESVALALNDMIDTSVWRIENNIRVCYLGKYKGQYPDKYYCDDMIVSRWDTSSSGTINYRWYTAVTSEWRLEDGKYLFDGFSCDNGQKVTVDPETTSYYVHVSRDGNEIQIEY